METRIFDGNEAASYVAYRTNEVCAIYPITPASTMGELVDEWSAKGIKNIWGTVPNVIELQSEGGAAGVVHGSLQTGVLTTTFTASQGLLLMLPNMYKIAGELNPCVIHVSARTLATHALSIFGDHSDVMSARTTGFAMLFGNSVQEAHDFALISQVATLKSRVPFMNIFDGFRTSHEVNKIDLISDEIIRAMVDEKDVVAHEKRALTSANPVIRGTAQNPDVFFQAREAGNKYYDALPGIVQEVMDDFAERTGRQYNLFDYVGAEDAEKVIILMGSGAGAVEELVEHLSAQGEKVGVLKVRLFLPFLADAFIDALPKTVKKISVLDRTKESGSIGEPLYQNVVNAFVETGTPLPTIVGGRYGLASKEFTPAMVKGVFDALDADQPKKHFTIGINDDVTHTSLEFDPSFVLEDDNFTGLFYGLGADGTVGVNKNSIKIIGETTDNYVQGYFVYDSKKSGSQTVSHLRFGKNPIRSTYLVSEADFVACHQFEFLTKYDVLANIKSGGRFLLNAPFSKDDVWNNLPKSVQEIIIEKDIEFYVINATEVAQSAGLGRRLNTILQTCFFEISEVIPKDLAIDEIKKAIKKSYTKAGEDIVQKNYIGVDNAIANLYRVDKQEAVSSDITMEAAVSDEAPDYMRNVLGVIFGGKGDDLPVSAFPADGTFPTATSQWEKRNISGSVPEWDEDLCTQCGKCAMICPHGCIRAKVADTADLAGAPAAFKSKKAINKEFSDTENYIIQTAVEDCTGCQLCVEICPAISKTDDSVKALAMVDQRPIREQERENWNFFLGLPEVDRTRVKANTYKGNQLYQPLFEFSGACPGCGETPYIKLITQLYGDRMLIANATGCSSIYGGNLPTTPYCTNERGMGPAWSNSLFEDNAEFGLGLHLGASRKTEKAFALLENLKDKIGSDLYSRITESNENIEAEKAVKLAAIDELESKLDASDLESADQLRFLKDNLVRKQAWIFGGDGWAYDIGYGGLDHVLGTGENVNILVMDTEVYSNTGGQNSKATPIGASAKFAVAGKEAPKKSLALQAIAFGTVYVAQIAMGAKDTQTLKAIQEAVNYDGTSIIIAYSACIAHGYDMKYSLEQQVGAVNSGHWPLFRYNPSARAGRRFSLDSKAPSIPLEDYMYKEARFMTIKKQYPERAEALLKTAQQVVDDRWERLAALKGT